MIPIKRAYSRYYWMICLIMVFSGIIASGLYAEDVLSAPTHPTPPHVSLNTDLPMITVTTVLDELNSDGDCSLREAIHVANTHQAVDACPADSSHIVLPAGTYTLSIAGIDEDAGLTGDLDITAPLIIRGESADTTLISAAELDRVFHIRGSVEVTITGVTIMKGVTSFTKERGGIYNEGGVLILQNSRIQDNVSKGTGGGLATSNTGETSLQSMQIAHNLAWMGGGGIDNRNKLTIVDSIIHDNTAISPCGGIRSRNASLILTSTLIIRNRGGGDGGLCQYDGDIGIYNSAIVDNVTSALPGGGMNIEHSTARLSNVTISGNKSAGEGSGLVFGTSHATLNNVTIAHNTANIDPEGIIHPGTGILISNDSIVELGNTLIADNVDLRGGAPDCAGSFVSLGYNLIENMQGCILTGSTIGNQLGLDPKLGDLQISPVLSSLGNTLIHPLLPDSPAIDAGSPEPATVPSGCLADDQRLRPRPQDGNNDGIARCDIGAFETSIPETFHPAIHGYSFTNRSGSTSWALYRDTFGPSVDNSLIARLFYETHYRPAVEGGSCSGMASSSALFYKTWIRQSDNSPLPTPIRGMPPPTEQNVDNHWHWLPNETANLILRYQGYDTGTTITYARLTYQKTLPQLLQDITDSIDQGLANPYILEIYGQYEGKQVGHALVPYRYERHEQSIDVYVYDPNYPDATDRAVHFDVANTATWSYLLWPGLRWGSNLPGSHIRALPLALWQVRPAIPSLLDQVVIDRKSQSAQQTSQRLATQALFPFPSSEAHSYRNVSIPCETRFSCILVCTPCSACHGFRTIVNRPTRVKGTATVKTLTRVGS